jgi:phosphoribosylaminoimidazole-succinocarboxamide synthase
MNYSTISNIKLDLSPEQEYYQGKVREVYRIHDKIVSIASDRISAFDHILPRPIPYKGQVLNMLAAYFLNSTRHIVPNWLESSPHPNVSVGKYCKPIKLEMVIRGYLAGHAWRVYNSSERMICGVQMPEGLRQSDPFPEAIITPATKAESGHDEDISREQIIERGIVTEAVYDQLEAYTRALYLRGTELANAVGLILVDTKYEFGMHDGKIYLIDEVHTPDSSRYFYLDGFNERQDSGIPQEQLSKEFVREWLMTHDFQGLEGQSMPEMPDDFVAEVSQKYIQLYESLSGLVFKPAAAEIMSAKAIEERVKKALGL